MVVSYETFGSVCGDLLPERLVLGETRIWDLGSVRSDLYEAY